MQMMMAFFETEAEFAARTDPARAPAYWGAWMAYVQVLKESGLVVSGNGLEAPSAATTLRLRRGARRVQDGPFADSKEQLAGYFILDVPDLDAALAWAERAPCAGTGAVELRPVLKPPPGA